MRRRRWRTAVLWVGCTLCFLIAVAFVVSARWRVWLKVPGAFIAVHGGALDFAWQSGRVEMNIRSHTDGLRYALVADRFFFLDFSLPLIYPFLAVAASTLLVWRFVPKFPRGHCRRCGYNLTDLTEARCPECGAGFESKGEWGDIGWCDQNVKAASLSDEEVVEAASRVHPDSTALIELLDEADRRKLAAIAPIARQHLSHPDPFASTLAVAVLQDLGDASDLPVLVELASHAFDHYHLAAILDTIVTLDPSRADFALETAAKGRDDEYFDEDYVMASVIVSLSHVLPNESPGLEARMLDWVVDSRLPPTQRESVYRRLAALPRTQLIEEFLVEFCVRDVGENPNLTEIVDDALRKGT